MLQIFVKYVYCYYYLIEFSIYNTIVRDFIRTDFVFRHYLITKCLMYCSYTKLTIYITNVIVGLYYENYTYLT